MHSGSEGFCFTWKIKNFSSCYQKNGQMLTSPTFTVETLWKSKWCLDLYPRGNHGFENYISFHLKRKNDDGRKKIFVDFTLEFIGDEDKKIESYSAKNHFFTKGGAWGWNEYMKINELTNAMKNMISDTLKVRCFLRNARESQITYGEVSTAICVERASFVLIVEKSHSNKKKTLDDLFVLLTITVISQENMISIFIDADLGNTSSLFVALGICLLEENGTECDLKQDSHLFESNKDAIWNFPYFLISSKLNSEKPSFLKNEQFTLKFYVSQSRNLEPRSTVMYKEYSTANSSPCTNTVEATVSTDVAKSLSSVDTIVVLQNYLRNMLKDKKHSDVKFKVEGRLFYAHKNILSARSPVFSAMFDQDMEETRTGKIDIKDINEDTLEQFLEFVYTESLDVKDCDQALELLLVGDKYQVQSLVDKCSLFLSTHLSDENACEILVAADTIRLEFLKTKLLEYIQTHAATILKSPEWPQWSEKNIKLANEIFSKLIARM